MNSLIRGFKIGLGVLFFPITLPAFGIYKAVKKIRQNIHFNNAIKEIGEGDSIDILFGRDFEREGKVPRQIISPSFALSLACARQQFEQLVIEEQDAYAKLSLFGKIKSSVFSEEKKSTIFIKNFYKKQLSPEISKGFAQGFDEPPVKEILSRANSAYKTIKTASSREKYRKHKLELAIKNIREERLEQDLFEGEKAEVVTTRFQRMMMLFKGENNRQSVPSRLHKKPTSYVR